MSQEVGQTELKAKTQQLLDGPLKHIRAAAIAAALLPLASVAATPASAQTVCGSGGNVCGFVFKDTNGNGIQDAGESGIEGVKVFVKYGTDTVQSETGPDGIYYFFLPPGTYPIAVQVPESMVPSPSNAELDDSVDSDGVPDGFGYSGATLTVVLSGANNDTDFGFVPTAHQNPGTGTPGYWKNHPEAWPVSKITVGGVEYTRDQAIAWMGKVGKDKTTTMFSSLVSAMLNVNPAIDNDDSCVSAAIIAGNNWMKPVPAGYGPVGNGVAASSYAWTVGEPIHKTLDAYNNGLLCVPHRQ